MLADTDPFEEAEALEFRAALRGWYARHLPPGWGREGLRFASPQDEIAFLRDWQRQLFEAGFAGLSWPREFGGQEASLVQQIIALEERDRVAAPLEIGVVGTQMVGPTIIRHGTRAQKARYLPKMLNGEEIWCQGFSEPGAGSDLAALRTRARRTAAGDWSVTGQKVWTSRAAFADQMILLARTDPDAPPHRGISAFLLPMSAPGLEVRPIRQVNGHQEFCEVFLDDVTVGDELLLGDVNDGWRVAVSTLSAERLALSRAFECRRLVADLAGARPAIQDSAEWMELAARSYATGVTLQRYVEEAATRPVGAEGSVTKLVASELTQDIARFALTVEPGHLDVSLPTNLSASVAWAGEYVTNLKNTIAGGTSQVQQTIIAGRVLGLPRSGAHR